MARDGKYGGISIPGIPDDEPIFILRAQDRAANETILDYEQNAKDEGATPQFLDGVQDALAKFEQWQGSHPDALKIPD